MEWRAQPRIARHPPQSQDRRDIARPAALGPDPVLVQGPGWRPKANQRQVRDRSRPADLPRCLPRTPMHRAGRWLFRMEGDQGSKGEAALRYRHEGRRTFRTWGDLGELERARPA